MTKRSASKSPQDALSAEQRSIIHHTLWRSAGRCYCGSRSDPDIADLVARGFMREHSAPGFLPASDAYFSVTAAGREAYDLLNVEGEG